MSDLWRLIPSLRGIVIFEAAARLKSFTRAAEELAIQQPSVSAAIKQLEEMLRVKLFLRKHRSSELTYAGQRLFATVSRSLNDIEQTANEVSHMKKERPVTLNASSAFTFYWMMPRLHDLRTAYPNIDLRLQSSDIEPDLDADNIDLAVRLGNGNWSGCESVLIAEEQIAPVAGPAFKSRLNAMAHPNELKLDELIHLEEPFRKRPGWLHWLNYHGVEKQNLSGGLRFNDYALVLQAALNNEGIAYGWSHIVQDLVVNEQLVTRDDWYWNTGQGIYLVWSKSHQMSNDASAVRDWILTLVASGK